MLPELRGNLLQGLFFVQSIRNEIRSKDRFSDQNPRSRFFEIGPVCYNGDDRYAGVQGKISCADLEFQGSGFVWARDPPLRENADHTAPGENFLGF